MQDSHLFLCYRTLTVIGLFAVYNWWLYIWLLGIHWRT